MTQVVKFKSSMSLDIFHPKSTKQTCHAITTTTYFDPSQKVHRHRSVFKPLCLESPHQENKCGSMTAHVGLAKYSGRNGPCGPSVYSLL